MSASGALVSSGQNPSPPRDLHPSWIDANVLKSIQCIACNVFLEMDGACWGVPALVNVPLRLMNIWRASHSGAYWQIGFDALAITSLYFSDGLQIPIALDVMSAAISAYAAASPLADEERYDKPPRDASILEASLDVLGLSEEAARDPVIVQNRYEALCNQWDRRIKEAGSSEPLLQTFRRLKYEATQAYATVCLHIERQEA